LGMVVARTKVAKVPGAASLAVKVNSSKTLGAGVAVSKFRRVSS
jgi:hypothetical protein